MGSIALTFEGGPHRAWTEPVLDALERNDARATFFVVATRAVQQCRLTSRLRRAGHTIGLSCDEPATPKRTRIDIAVDLDRALARLGEMGIRPRLWRPPEGAHATTIERLAEERGLTLVDWTADTCDWRDDSAETTVARLTPELRDGAIIRLHEPPRVSCARTVRVVTLLTARAADLGLDVTALGPDGCPHAGDAEPQALSA